ncbi:DUF6166 domain-containing protein [Mycolicibacterium sphagni]|uniref:Ferredoxin n=1 Tax=Mycolicibacterium sphagni TaxID=1786 RepID=A0ABX2JWV7_9MYCO|nr:DUF6166 domain-containing protein [Mycolicibacterium sphagni]NTY62141.1 hypothetical protein [Mycolicibacterium sphagni]
MTNTTAADTDQILYRGHTDGSTVTIERPGAHGAVRLPHYVKHSPTGFSWGYAGSGPADLARSLLIDALGDSARCNVCHGTNQVVYDTATDTDIPLDLTTRELIDAEPDRYSQPMDCLACENGCTVRPPLYQEFKFDVVSTLHGSWTLTRADIVAWVDQHQQP